jgi:hypothetical protein
MTATIKTDLVGVRQAVASLNKIEPGLRKQFALELNQIAAPAIQAAQQRYTALGVPLSGMALPWSTMAANYFHLIHAKPLKASK